MRPKNGPWTINLTDSELAVVNDALNEYEDSWFGWEDDDMPEAFLSLVEKIKPLLDKMYYMREEEQEANFLLSSCGDPDCPICKCREEICVVDSIDSPKPKNKETDMSVYMSRGQSRDEFQVQYFGQRLDAAAWAKEAEMEREFGLADNAVPASPRELLEAIESKQFVVKDEDMDAKPWMGVMSAFKWRDPAKKADYDGYNKAVDAMRAEKRKVADTIVIGDPKQIVASLYAFEQRTFH